MKVVIGLTVEEMPPTSKLPHPPYYRKGKGLMMTQGPIITNCHPPLLREDSCYAIRQLLSIIKDNDYEDLGNPATEAIGETGLFSLAQVCAHPHSFLSLCYAHF